MLCFRKKLFKFPVKLGRQRLIVGDDQRGLIQLLNHIRHRKGLTRPRDSQKRLRLISLPEALHQLRDGRRLIAGGLIFGMQLKMIHGNLLLALSISKAASPPGLRSVFRL